MNILEQKRKLLGHCYMGGGGSSGGGGGGLSSQSSDTRNALRSNEGYGSTDTGGGSAAVSGGRDSAAQAREAAESAAAEAANRQAIADQAAREQASREQAAREARDAQMAAEQASREQAAREQAAREQAASDQAAREQATREQAARDAREAQMASEQAAREQAAREQAAQAAAEAKAAQDAADARATQDAADRAAAEKASQDARDATMQRLAAEKDAADAEAARQPITQSAPEAAPAAPLSALSQFPSSPDATTAAPSPLTEAAAPAATEPAAPSPLAVMSSAGQMTPENANALANQETVRSFLAQVAKDKEVALSKPGEQYNVNSPNVGTSLTNAALAAVDSGLNQQTTKIGAGKNAEESTRDVTTLTSNIPIASFLGYTGEDGNAAISYGEAKQLQALGLGNLTGVNLNNMPGTGLSVMGGDGTPVGGLTYNEPGQTAESVVAATDAARFAEKVWGAAKNFIPGYGMVTMAAKLLSGEMSIGDLVTGIGINKLAPMIGTTPSALTALINGNFADAITGQLMGYAVKDISKTYSIDPRLVTIGLSELGVPSAVNNTLKAGNLNWGTTGKIAGAIQSPINAVSDYVGSSLGSSTSTGNVTDMGDSIESQIDRAISEGSSRGSSQGSSSAPSTPAPASTPTPTPTPTPAAPVTPSSPLSTLSIPAVGAAGTSASSDSGSSGTSSSSGSSLKESWLGGTGTSAKAGKSAIDPLSATSPSISKSENMDDTQTTSDNSLKPDYYAYGDVPDISTNLQLKKGGSVPSPLVAANRVVRKASGGGIMATPLMVATGGDVPHKGSHYVQGAGGGQDDLIDARLADGEYVFDADIVAALGDGSNKEGAKKLDAMREAIRKHKRSAPANKIPPKAKSPLAYMRG